MTRFSHEAFDWFKGLEADNSKAYFDAHRDVFESQIKQPLTDLLDGVAIAKDGRVKLFRQNRDIRFSKDKSPYKTNTYGVVHPNAGQSGFYVSVSKDGLYAGGGYYEMAKDQLERFREAVADEDSGRAAQAIFDDLESDGFDIWAEDLKSAPRGYPKDHPRISLLRHKRWVAGKQFSPDAVMAGEDMLGEALKMHEKLGALSGWLDEHVGPSEIPPEARFGNRR